jgi:hypothetical protein
MGFFSSSRKIPGGYLKLGNERFLPHPLQFIIHYRPIAALSGLLSASLNRLSQQTLNWIFQHFMKPGISLLCLHWFSLRSILILSFHLHQCLSSCLFHSGCLTKIIYAFHFLNTDDANKVFGFWTLSIVLISQIEHSVPGNCFVSFFRC